MSFKNLGKLASKKKVKLEKKSAVVEVSPLDFHIGNDDGWTMHGDFSLDVFLYLTNEIRRYNHLCETGSDALTKKLRNQMFRNGLLKPSGPTDLLRTHVTGPSQKLLVPDQQTHA